MTSIEKRYNNFYGTLENDNNVSQDGVCPGAFVSPPGNMGGAPDRLIMMLIMAAILSHNLISLVPTRTIHRPSQRAKSTHWERPRRHKLREKDPLGRRVMVDRGAKRRGEATLLPRPRRRKAQNLKSWIITWRTFRKKKKKESGVNTELEVA